MDGSEQFETYVGEALQSHMQSQHIEVLEAEVARLWAIIDEMVAIGNAAEEEAALSDITEGREG